MNDSFFQKNGTIQGLMDFAGTYQGAKSDNAPQRLGAIKDLLSLIVSIFV